MNLKVPFVKLTPQDITGGEFVWINMARCQEIYPFKGGSELVMNISVQDVEAGGGSALQPAVVYVMEAPDKIIAMIVEVQERHLNG